MSGGGDGEGEEEDDGGGYHDVRLCVEKLKKRKRNEWRGG